METGLFGLERETKVRQSRVRECFTPHIPIDNERLFMGRQAQVAGAIEALNTPGQHMIVFGERGVGKSSLARVSCQLLLKKLVSGELHQRRCDSDDTFHTVWLEILQEYGYEGVPTESNQTRKEGGQAGLKIPVAEAGVKTEKEQHVKTIRDQFRPLSPSVVARFLQDKEGLILIDEIDALASTADRQRMAQVVKHLSDADSQVKVLLVGVASAAAELTDGHPSVQRCLREIRLDPMDRDEIRSIIVTGSQMSRIVFTGDVTKSIVDLAAGYPYFAQLLGLKCAEEAAGNDLTTVDQRVFQAALKSAVTDADATLQRCYSEAVRSAGTEMYSQLVQCAAELPPTEFTAAALREALSQQLERRVEQSEIMYSIQKLVGNDDSRLFRRLQRGVYRFSDPRMRCYIRMAATGRSTSLPG